MSPKVSINVTELDALKQLLGGNCRRRREALGLTLKQLESLSGASFTTIHKLEQGRINPSLETLLRISKALDERGEVWKLFKNRGGKIRLAPLEVADEVKALAIENQILKQRLHEIEGNQIRGINLSREIERKLAKLESKHDWAIVNATLDGLLGDTGEAHDEDESDGPGAESVLHKKKAIPIRKRR